MCEFGLLEEDLLENLPLAFDFVELLLYLRFLLSLNLLLSFPEQSEFGFSIFKLKSLLLNGQLHHGGLRRKLVRSGTLATSDIGHLDVLVLEELLDGEELRLAAHFWSIRPEGNWRDEASGRQESSNILHQRSALPDLADIGSSQQNFAFIYIVKPAE